MTTPPDGIFDPELNTYTTGTGQFVRYVHAAEDCAGRACCIHDPSDHPMRSFPTHLRSGGAFDIKPMHMERICPHGIGHPDPDDAAYHKSVGSDVSVHGCDGCCRAPEPEWPIHDNDCPAKSESGYGPCTCTVEAELEPRFEHDPPPVEECICVYPDVCFCSNEARLRRAIQDEIDDTDDTPPPVPVLGPVAVALIKSLEDDRIEADDYIETLEGNLEALQMSYDTVLASRNFWRDLGETAIKAKETAEARLAEWTKEYNTEYEENEKVWWAVEELYEAYTKGPSLQVALEAVLDLVREDRKGWKQ